MKSLFEYVNFRCYLADYYDFQKSNNPTFSYRNFSTKIGFKSKDFIYRVIHKEKLISDKSISMISKAIGHNETESDYFENLVKFNQTETPREKNRYYQRLDQLKEKILPKSKSRLLEKNQYAFFSEWYHPVIRAILEIIPFKKDFAWLAKQVHPAITAKDAKRSVKILENLGLIKKNLEGVFELTDKSVSTPTEVSSVALVQYYQKATHFASEAIGTLPKSQRNVSGLTLGISSKNYEKVVGKINQFRNEIARLATSDDEANQVFQLNLYFYPNSIPLKGKGKD